MDDRTVIGKIAALEKCPTTIDNFSFWTDKNMILSPFDVVAVEHVEGSVTYGVVEEISHITDSESFLGEYFSHDFGNLFAESNTERIGMNYVNARVVGNTKNIYIPVHNGARVFLGTPDDIQNALGLKNISNPAVCGYLEMYSSIKDKKIELPVFVNSDFLVGPEGAHLNISGISGLATKTSYAMFLLNALQQKSIKNNDNSNGTAFIFLNVKGRDLLSVDIPNIELREEDKKMYDTMGLDLCPFKNVKYFYPYGGSGNVKSYISNTELADQLEAGKAKKFKYTFNEDCESLELLFSNIDDPNQTIESIINYIISKQHPFKEVDSWENMMENVQEMGRKGNNSDNKEISVMSWRKFARIIKKSIGSDPMFCDRVSPEKDEVRLEDEIKKMRSNDVYVVDIAKADENMQAFVFGSVIEAVTKLKLGDFDDELGEDANQIPNRIVIFVDELNKYASSDIPKNSPILRLLLDIAERGRSLGIILFSAEQFKSSIHKRITGNCSTHAYGRTNSIEVSDKTYSFIPQTYKNLMTRLKQGQYVIQNPVFSSLLKIRFPLPLYMQDKGIVK